MGYVLMQDGPKPLDRIEMGAVWWQLDQMDTAGCPGQKSPDIGPFVVGGIVPDDEKDALVRRLDLGKKLDGPDPINGFWLDKRRTKCFEVQGTMNVDAATSCCGLHSRI